MQANITGDNVRAKLQERKASQMNTYLHVVFMRLSTDVQTGSSGHDHKLLQLKRARDFADDWTRKAFPRGENTGDAAAMK